MWCDYILVYRFFFSSRRRHTRCALVTGVQTCALPILRRTTSSTAWPVAAWALQDSAVERSEPAKPRDRMTWAILTTFYPASIPSPAQRPPRDLIAKPCVQGPRLAQRQVAQPQRRQIGRAHG